MKDLLELDGRTGEGGGQLVRIAIALSAVLTQPIRITNVRAKRGNPQTGKGAGLKSQHLTAISCLATLTNATVSGLFVGSSTIEFRPSLPPSSVSASPLSPLRIVGTSPAASALLIFQALLPFLLFTAAPGRPVKVYMLGGTNTAWSPSYEYVDQVLLPVLERRFGIRVGGRLLKRGWGTGPLEHGEVAFEVERRGNGLKVVELEGREGGAGVGRVEVTVVAPGEVLEQFRDALKKGLDGRFPHVEIHFHEMEESGHPSRVYILLVAISISGSNRWGRDVLTSLPRSRGNGKRPQPDPTQFVNEVVEKLILDFAGESERGAEVDSHLQDQLIIFQSLAEGRSKFTRNEEDTAREGGREEEGTARDRSEEPFGEGSLHSKTARWVAAKFLPEVAFYDNGTVCEGAGVEIER